MNSSPIPPIPTRSKIPEAPAWSGRSPGSSGWRMVLACALALTLGEVQAHQAAAIAIPEDPGWQLGLGGVATYLDANAPLPSAQLAGFLLQGDVGIDRRRLGLEHAVFDLGYRFNPQWGSQLALGKHDTDSAHVEAAVLRGRFSSATGADQQHWRLDIGRQKPQLGPVLTEAGHFDRFALVPLAKRAAVNDDWIDDGVQLGWYRELPDVTLSADLGLWRGALFPGAAAGRRPTPGLHVGLERGDWAVDLFAAYFKPQGRGARVLSAGGGHTHTAPLCDPTLSRVLCFDGNSRLSGASVRWASHDWPVTLALAGWQRQETGDLSSANGQVRYDGDTRGVWVDAIWRMTSQWQAGLRLERLQATHRLDGAGATLLAVEAGFNRYQPSRRWSAMLGTQVAPQLDLRIEAGQESVAGASVRFALLRLTWQTNWLGTPVPD